MLATERLIEIELLCSGKAHHIIESIPVDFLTRPPTETYKLISVLKLPKLTADRRRQTQTFYQGARPNKNLIPSGKRYHREAIDRFWPIKSIGQKVKISLCESVWVCLPRCALPAPLCPACPVGRNYRTGVEFTCDSGAYSSGVKFFEEEERSVFNQGGLPQREESVVSKNQLRIQN
jgi:hypothetical protein